MKLRKTNAVFSLLTTILLLGHAIYVAIWMLTKGAIPKNEGYLPWILTGVAVVHALLSVALMASIHKGKGKQKSKKYAKMNTSTIVQRISGILLVIFTWLHVAGAAGFTKPPQFIHATVPPLFFTICMAHVYVSISKAFITLGIGSVKFIKSADVVVKVICALTLVADIIGFYLHVC